MKKVWCLLAFYFLTRVFVAYAGPGDTILVQAFSFGSPQEGWVLMPPDSLQFEKIYMRYTLKCNPNQSPACGEWDYLTYTYLHQPVVEPQQKNAANYQVNGLSPDSFSYSTIAAYQLNPGWQYFPVYTDTIALADYTVGSGSGTTEAPFGTSDPVSRTQLLWKASELLTAGMAAGPITAIRFNVLAAGGSMKNLSVFMKHTALESLSSSSYEPAGFQETYSGTTALAAGTWNNLPFTVPFNWDGVSNLIVEITYDNDASLPGNLLASDPADENVLSTSGNDHNAHFQDGTYISIPSEAFASVDSAITVSFWFRGDDFLQDRTTFEAVNAYNQRVLNVHLPWSDGNIYWDAGITLIGSYDRIYKHADEPDYKNEWHHWAFTKNVADGSMKVYRDGLLWHSGTGATRLLEGIQTFWIGSALWNSNVSANGKLDEFAIWNVALDETTIQQYLYRDLDATHPYSNHLLVYYPFDESGDFTVKDASGNGFDGSVIGAQTGLYQAKELFRNFENQLQRPQIVLEQGIYISYLDSILVVDTAWMAPLTLVLFDDSLNPGLATDTLLVWTPYYQYILNNDGAISDSVYISPEATLHLIITPYITEPLPALKRWELGRYITPYGIGLSMGSGWTWNFDLSDYATLLRDSVFLTAGNWQELLDLQLVFIEGTPTRVVRKIDNLWNGSFWYGVSWDPIENHLTPKKLFIEPETQGLRLKARVTGHGFGGNLNCAEFCSRNHYWVTNGDTTSEKKVWRDNCDRNPLYPQGGTWVYSRANWCPGAEVETYDIELTPYLIAGDSLALDYDIQEYEWNGNGSTPNYVIETQLVQYGSLSFLLDAAVEEIIRPNNNLLFGRMNPVCNHPEIVIRNNAGTPITSLEITYGIEGGSQQVYQWTGNLAFLDTARVKLDQVFAPASGNNNRFIVSVAKPNGGADEYEFNNSMASVYSYPPVYPDSFIVEVITNTASHETSYTLTDENGNLLINRDNLADNTTYRDTLFLTAGCYVFRLDDTGGDGLSFWANNDGNGAARFRKLVPGPYLKSFGGDFGAEIYHEFTIGYYLETETMPDTQSPVLSVYPNPSDGEVWIDVLLPERSEIKLMVTDLNGQTVYSSDLGSVASYSTVIDLNGRSSGIYLVQVVSKGFTMTRKVMLVH